MKQLAQQIKNLRTTKNLSQDELAEKLYISRQAVSKWENSEATPDIDKLVQLAEIFGVSLDYLVLGKEPEKEIVVEQLGKMNVWEFLVRRIQTTSYKRRCCRSYFSCSYAFRWIIYSALFLTKLAKQQAFSLLFCYNSHD